MELARGTARCFHLELGVRTQKAHVSISSLKLAWALKLGSLTKNKQTSKKPWVNIKTLTLLENLSPSESLFPFCELCGSHLLCSSELVQGQFQY